MKILFIKLIAIFALSLSLIVNAAQYVVIDSATASAPLRSSENGTFTWVRIPAGQKLEVLSKKTIKGYTAYMPSVTWYKVQYSGFTGWVSELVTER